jgi:hypothetical protein
MKLAIGCDSNVDDRFGLDLSFEVGVPMLFFDLVLNGAYTLAFDSESMPLDLTWHSLTEIDLSSFDFCFCFG